MKYRSSVGPACALFLSLSCSTSLSAQTASSPANIRPTTTTTAAADTPDELLPLSYAELVIENPGKQNLPESRARRIFRETIREVARHLNPTRPPTVLAKIVLRIGEPGFNVETLVDNGERHTVVRMQSWNDQQFARLVARAARHGLFSDVELDAAADTALKHVNSVTSVEELRRAQ